MNNEWSTTEDREYIFIIHCRCRIEILVTEAFLKDFTICLYRYFVNTKYYNFKVLTQDDIVIKGFLHYIYIYIQNLQ